MLLCRCWKLCVLCVLSPFIRASGIQCSLHQAFNSLSRPFNIQPGWIAVQHSTSDFRFTEFACAMHYATLHTLQTVYSSRGRAANKAAVHTRALPIHIYNINMHLFAVARHARWRCHFTVKLDINLKFVALVAFYNLSACLYVCRWDYAITAQLGCQILRFCVPVFSLACVWVCVVLAASMLIICGVVVATDYGLSKWINTPLEECLWACRKTDEAY